jgi:hypothetical protein
MRPQLRRALTTTAREGSPQLYGIFFIGPFSLSLVKDEGVALPISSKAVGVAGWPYLGFKGIKAPQLASGVGGLDDHKTAGGVDQDILICTAQRRLAQPPAAVD